MSLFQELRALVFLRRIARALEHLASLKDEQLHPQRHPPKMVDFSAPTYQEWQQEWEKRHE